jgi:hypothetical protein
LLAKKKNFVLDANLFKLLAESKITEDGKYYPHYFDQLIFKLNEMTEAALS